MSMTLGPGLVALCDIRPQNEAGLLLQRRSLTRGVRPSKLLGSVVLCLSELEKVLRVCFLCGFWCMCYFVCLFSVVWSSAVDCMERLVSEVTYYVSSGTWDSTNSILNTWMNKQIGVNLPESRPTTHTFCSVITQKYRGQWRIYLSFAETNVRRA